MKYFNLHTHYFTNNIEILELVNQYPLEFQESIPYFSIGIHPWKIEIKSLENELSILEHTLKFPNCLAIGECGLDKRIETKLELQIQVFEKQLILAQQYQKPVVIHCVAAFQEVIEIKKKLKISVPMIIHGFSKNIQTAKLLIENGFYLSFGKYLLRNPELKTVFQSVPNDKIFLETDTVQETIMDIYALAAKYKKMEMLDLKTLINNNFETVFLK